MTFAGAGEAWQTQFAVGESAVSQTSFLTICQLLGLILLDQFFVLLMPSIRHYPSAVALAAFCRHSAVFAVYKKSSSLFMK
jgi:hypothetical protein